MARIENTVFISYRRIDVYIALAVYKYLTDQGYDVFFDYTSIPSGDFEQIIMSNIKARAHFIVILTPGALDRCSEPGDWLRREIETAIDEKRNIVPLFFKGFGFGSPSVLEKLTGKLKNFSRYNGMNVHEDYFDAAMERLSRTFLNVPLDTVLHPVSMEVRKVVKKEQIAANQAVLRKEQLDNLIQQQGSKTHLEPLKKERLVADGKKHKEAEGRAREHAEDELIIEAENLKAAAEENTKFATRINWQLPVVENILNKGRIPEFNEEFIEYRAQLIQETLASFGAPVQVVEINGGPSITQYGVEPLFVNTRTGRVKVRAAKIESLADDIAVALGVRNVRIQVPVPGHSYVGIEVPNEKPTAVALRDIIESKLFQHDQYLRQR